MRYVALIYDNELAYSQLSQEAVAAEYQGYDTFGTENARFIQGGMQLQSAGTATTIRIREGKTLTTDGPFAETKEQLGGYYLLNCKDLDEAIAVAAQIPAAKHGSIEVRPVVEFGG
jgi:hypothetical protein